MSLKKDVTFQTDIRKNIQEIPMKYFIYLMSLFLLSNSVFAQKKNEPVQSKTGTAIFAGGCFWCMEPPFEKLDGVISVISGYTGGTKKNPTYEEVSAGGTGHTEAVKIEFDPKKISFKKLLDVFWRNIDPTVKDRQFCDSGPQYRSGIFYLNDEQKKEALESRKGLEKKFSSIYTEITPIGDFYPAEEYHQDYYKKNPIRYKYYRHGCGRDKRLEELWGKN